jgi:Holliday junction resolvase RusA-like endonuclease
MTLKFATLPPSTNHTYGSGRNGSRYMKPAVRAAKEAIGWEARSQYRGEPLIGPLDVDVTVYWPDRRKHDHDNMKVLWDALNGIVWQDDGQITDSHVHKRFDKGNPRVEMIVKAGEI